MNRKLSFALSALLLASCGSDGPDFKAIYDDIVDSYPFSANRVVTLVPDGFYLKTDTNPDNREDFSSVGCFTISRDAPNRCGFSAAIWEDMLDTAYIEGTKTATSNGIKVSWHFHPGLGLECRYTKA